MQRLLDVIAVLILFCGISALVAAVYMILQQRDFVSFFLLALGVGLLRSSIDLLRPRNAR